VERKKEKSKTQQHKLGTNVRVRGFNARLLDRSQFASEKSCNRPTRSRFPVVFLGPRTNAELVPTFHVALHGSHSALMVRLKYRPALTWLWLGLDHPVHGGYGWGRPTPRRRSNCQTKKLISTKTNWPTDCRSQCNLKLNLRHCIANCRPVLSSERAPYMKNKESNCHWNKCNVWSPAPKGARHQDTSITFHYFLFVSFFLSDFSTGIILSRWFTR
jgi:hypothetical protein